MKKLLEKIASVFVVTFGLFLEHGWILVVAVIMLFIADFIFDIQILRVIAAILLGVALVIIAGILFGLAFMVVFFGVKLLINKYKKEYDNSVKAGANRANAFIKFSLKGIGVFLLILLALVFVYYIGDQR